MDLTGVGIWSSQLRYGNVAESADAAAELDDLGFRALWIPDVGGAVFDAVGNLLAATKRTTIATGILNLWMHTPSEVATSYAALTAAHGDRFLLGIGVSHAPLIDAGEPGATANRWSPPPPSWTAIDATSNSRCLPIDGCWPRSARKCCRCPRDVPPAHTPTSSPPSTPRSPVGLWATDPCCCQNRP